MKLTPISSFLTSLLVFLSLSHLNIAEAGTFGQIEVEQADFIAIARPYGHNKYDLLILQQVPGKRQCWQESGSNPTLINPLLLNFDFTGSCERSTDSNGYSVRIDGQDYGLDYLLRLVERNGELVLVATHRTNYSQPEIIIGRSEGLGQGFLKIQLDPGWRFTKRTYQGQVLGHVYLTGDSSAIRPPASSEDVVTSPNVPSVSTPSETSVREFTFTSPSLPSNNSRLQQSNDNWNNSSFKNTSEPEPSSNTWEDSSFKPEINRSTPPVVVSPSNNNSSATLPHPPSPASNFSDLPPLPVPTQVNNSTIVPRPDPSGRQSLSQVMTGLSQPQGGESTSAGYRVLVEARDRSQQTEVKRVYPDAFQTKYQGRSLWQIGLFSTRQNAESALQGFENQGITGLIIP